MTYPLKPILGGLPRFDQVYTSLAQLPWKLGEIFWDDEGTQFELVQNAASTLAPYLLAAIGSNFVVSAVVVQGALANPTKLGSYQFPVAPGGSLAITPTPVPANAYFWAARKGPLILGAQTAITAGAKTYLTAANPGRVSNVNTNSLISGLVPITDPGGVANARFNAYTELVIPS